MKLQYVLGLLFGLGALAFFIGCGLHIRARPASALDTAAPEALRRSRIAVALNCMGIVLALCALVGSRLPHMFDPDRPVPLVYVAAGGALLAAGVMVVLRRQMRGGAERPWNR